MHLSGLWRISGGRIEVLFGWRKRNNTFRLDFLVVQIRWGKRLGRLGWVSESLAGLKGRHEKKKDQVGQTLQERFATGNERDLRKSLTVPELQRWAITPALSSTDTQIALLKGFREDSLDFYAFCGANLWNRAGYSSCLPNGQSEIALLWV